MNEIEKLKRDKEILRKALEGVLNSAMHPDIALRAALVDLKPVRKALKETES
jgi:hypothetical protein